MGMYHSVYIGPAAIVDESKGCWAEFMEEHGDRLAPFFDEGDNLPADKLFWVANVDYEGQSSLPRMNEFSGWFAADGVDAIKETEAFIKAFAAEIEALEQTFGEVSVEWGVLGGWA